MMTERFIVDTAGTLIDIETRDTFDIVEEVCPLLNEKEETITRLKKDFDSCSHNWALMYDEAKNKVEELSKENEQLKQYIYDNLDEDICDVCSYQYLEKSKMDKYYVAKCKKGYDNCSKGTVIHCKDFKFKELKRND